MNLLQACESLASKILSSDAPDPSEIYISAADLERWQALFSFAADEAAIEIRSWRADYARATIPPEAWEAAGKMPAQAGFDKETYEYSITRQRQTPQESHSGGEEEYVSRQDGWVSILARGGARDGGEGDAAGLAARG